MPEAVMDIKVKIYLPLKIIIQVLVEKREKVSKDNVMLVQHTKSEKKK